MRIFGRSQRKEGFFELFDRSALNVHEGAVALLDLMEHYDDLAAKVQHIKDIEHAGDEITHQVMERLAKTFITPLDRDDIQHLASRLDDILDNIDAAANRMLLYRIQTATEDAKELSRGLVRATQLLVRALPMLRNLKQAEEIRTCCVQVHAEENEGDRLMHHGLAELFDTNQDVRDIIKWKDIYQVLEDASDRCEDVADVVQTILVKYA